MQSSGSTCCGGAGSDEPCGTIPNDLKHLGEAVHGIELDIIVEEASHTLKSGEDVCETGHDGYASSIP